MKPSKKGLLLIALAIIVMLGGLQAATQYVAWQFYDNPRLGFRVAEIGSHIVYVPWAVLSWVKTYREQAPSAFATAGCIIVPCFLFPAFIAILASKRKRLEVKAFGADAWGTFKDAEKAGIVTRSPAPPAAVILGKMPFKGDRRLLHYNGPEHQLVVGASRAGKGVGHVIPTLLSWPESVFVYDPKEECYDIAGRFRSKFSHCFFLNFNREDSARFNFLMEVPKGRKEVPYAQVIAAGLIDASSDAPGGGWDFFDKSSFILITAIIIHVLYSAPDDEKNLEQVRSSLFDLDRTLLQMAGTHHMHRHSRSDPAELDPDEHGNPVPITHPEVARVAALFLRMSSKQRDAIQGTAITMLAVFSDPIVCDVTRRSDFRAGDLVCADAPVSCFLQVAPTHQLRLRPLTRLFIGQMTAALLQYQFKDTAGRKKKHKILMQLDEFPSLGRLTLFVNQLKQMAGYGMKCHLFVQSFKDIFDAYGRDATLIDNMHVLVAFAGADSDSNEQISKMTGTSTEYRDAQSQGPGMFGSVSTSQSEQLRALLSPGDVRQLPYDEQLVFVTGSKPFRTPKLRYYEDRLFLSRATDIRAGGVGPDQSKRMDVPFPSDTGHGDWIGVRAVYLHEPTEEELDALADKGGGGAGKAQTAAEPAPPTAAEISALAAENARFEAEIDARADFAFHDSADEMEDL